MKGTEARGKELHRYPPEYPLFRGQPNLCGIKRDVPSQIPSECARASDIFSSYQVQLDNLKCACILCFSNLGAIVGAMWQTSGNTISCLFALLREGNERMRRLCETMERRDNDRHCAHTGVHTHARDSRLIVRTPPFRRPAHPPLLHPHSVCVISVDPCLPPSRTAASPVKRWDRCERAGPSSAPH